MAERTTPAEERRDVGSRVRPVVAFGLLIALVLPPLYALVLQPALFQDASSPTATAVGLAVMWALCLAVLALVRFVERRPWASVGVRPPGLRWLVLAAGIGLVLSLLVPALGALAELLLPTGDSGTVGSVGARHHWLVLLLAVLTAAVTEEVLFRGYALERLLELSGSKTLAAIVSLASFTLTHGGSWALSHVIGVVIPLGAALTLLYLWRRNLIVVIVAHFVVDLPLVFLGAVAG